MSVILMTTLFYKALILQGEIWRWSLLGLKGLMVKLKNKFKISQTNVLPVFVVSDIILPQEELASKVLKAGNLGIV